MKNSKGWQDSEIAYYVPNVFKFTKISAKQTKRYYAQAQKHQRRPNVITSKFFTALYICNNSRMASLHYFHLICRTYVPGSVLLFFQF